MSLPALCLAAPRPAPLWAFRPQALLHLREPPLQELEPASQLRPCVLAATGQLGSRDLAATRQLVTRVSPPAGDLVDKLSRPTARHLGRPGSRLERPLDRVPKGVADPAVARFFATLAQGWEAYAQLADHLRPSAPIHADALLPGDPGRALALAQDLLERPRMANHARGLWGYSGATADGQELTIQSTGLGGPSVAVVLSELAGLGVARAIRIGTCRALDPRLGAGTVLVAREAVDEGGPGPGAPDATLTQALTAELDGVEAGPVAVTDAYYDPEWERRSERWRAAGAVAVDLGTAALFHVGARERVAVASALVVSRSAAGKGLDDEGIEGVSLEVGRAAVAALAA